MTADARNLLDKKLVTVALALGWVNVTATGARAHLIRLIVIVPNADIGL